MKIQSMNQSNSNVVSFNNNYNGDEDDVDKDE